MKKPIPEKKCSLTFYIQPNAKRSEWIAEYADGYKLRIAAPAIEGKANAALVEFLANSLDLKKSQIKIIGGELSKQKRVGFDLSDAMSYEMLLSRISQRIADHS
ncbi:DUF167 domain-containing protein [Ampullimonas aquatilis]|uniref:DUF167 domain-containing protein n=1 Tax=Ampullimonas aquatilis TaxID=1341549 RepID=UPI003C7727F2